MPISVDVQKRMGDFLLQARFFSKSRRIGILGASGSGKSMTLKCIAGIETPDAGNISIDGKTFFDSAAKLCVKPQKRRVGYMFQNYALFPTMTVGENVRAGCVGKRSEKKKQAMRTLEQFHLSDLAGRMPHELSGGQQQRVALARMMASKPDVILLDEPFSALDVFLKDRTQRSMQEILADFAGVVVLVSHNRDEIYRFCEELVIIDEGKALLCGRTREVFEHPRYYEAARLTGCKNFSKIKRIDDHSYKALDWGITMRTKVSVPIDADCIGFRAHDFIPVWGGEAQNSIPVRMSSQAKLPFEHNYYLEQESGAEPVCWFVQRERALEVEKRGMPDCLALPEDKVMFLKYADQDGGYLDRN